MEIGDMLNDLCEKRESYKKISGKILQKCSGATNPYVINMDYASLYPNIMKDFSMTDEYIKEQKRIKREKKLKRIIGEELNGI